MKQQDIGATCGTQTHRSLTSRCYEKEEEKRIKSVVQEKSILIEIESIVEVQLEGKTMKNKKFVVLAMSDKFHGKWFVNRKNENEKLAGPFQKKEALNDYFPKLWH